MNNQPVLFLVLETSRVPFGEEPETLSNPIPYAEACAHIEYLNSLNDGGFYEMCEA
jgi:hypothetical protein